jgi:RHS repeat-associated protein
MRYTGQRQEESIGLYFYGARWYDSALGRFTSPDTIIPAQQGVMGNDRYAYTNNNPLSYTDPTGHSVDCGMASEQGCRENAMIEEALDTYEVDTTYINGTPTYNPDLDDLGEYDRITGSVELGPDAFSSSGYLASVIGHENVHGQQEARGRWYASNSGNALNEIEAYDWEIDQYYNNGNPFGLNTSQIRSIENIRDDYLNLFLDVEDRQYVSQGYVIPDEPAMLSLKRTFSKIAK